MSERPEKTATVLAWVRKAESDFRIAELALKAEPAECPFDAVCFHAQQIVEKYLKALLSYRDIHFRKVHDIEELMQLFPLSLKPPIDAKEQDMLTGYVSTGRYPGLPADPGAEEAREAMVIARQVRDWARTLLPDTVLP